MNKAQVKAKQKRINQKTVEQFQMQGAKYAISRYKTAVAIVLGLGQKRLERIDQKFMELLTYDEVMQARHKNGVK